jgi:hypothetical protein
VVLSDTFDEESGNFVVAPSQKEAEDATEVPERDVKEADRLECLELDRCSKSNTERRSKPRPTGAPHRKRPMAEAPEAAPTTSEIPRKHGWVDDDAL